MHIGHNNNECTVQQELSDAAAYALSRLLSAYSPNGNTFQREITSRQPS